MVLHIYRSYSFGVKVVFYVYTVAPSRDRVGKNTGQFKKEEEEK